MIIFRCHRRFAGYEKDVVMFSKKSEDSPFTSFMGIGVIDLPPQTVFDSIRNPQLRFTYDNMLKVCLSQHPSVHQMKG